MSFILFILLFSPTCLYSREISFGPFFQQNLDLEENVDPLYEAILKKDLPTANMFLQNGANIRYINKEGRTLLHLATQSNYCKIIDNLIQKGIMLDTQDNNGNTALHLALEHGHLEAARLLIKNGANIHYINKEGQTPLHLAAQFNYCEIINNLIQKGTTLDTQDNNGNTALHLALEHGHLEAAGLVIQQKANTRLVNKQGKNLLHLIAVPRYDMEKNDLEEYLESNLLGFGCAIHSLHVIYLENYIDTLIQQNVSLEAKDKDRNTPFHVALDYENVYVIKPFIRHRAKCNFSLPEHLFTLIKFNLLSSLCEKDLDKIKDKIAKNLIFRKIETKKYLRNLLYFAASSANAATIQFLLTCGAEVNISKFWQASPLNRAALSKKTDNIEFLLAHGASLRDLDEKERSYVGQHIESQIKSYLEKTGPVVAKSTFLLFKK